MSADKMYREPYEARVAERVQCMVENFDFRGKTVLDIGCNTGAVACEVGRFANFVMGVDVDRSAIINARVRAGQVHDTAHCTFHRTVDLGEAWIWSRKYDVVLCLSVLHHIMADSQYYTDSGSGWEQARQIMAQIRDNCRWMWFEMGSSREFAPWAAKMPTMRAQRFGWIERYLADVGFSDIKIFPSPMLQHHRFQAWLHRHAYHTMKEYPTLRHLTGFDDRDGRSLFLCRGGLL